MDETFLNNTIQSVSKALLDTALIEPSLSNANELQLAAVLVGVLLEFLRGMIDNIV